LDKLNWEVKHKYQFNKEIDFLDTVLSECGIENIKAFLNVNEKNTHDPFLFKNMNEGLKIFHNALNKKIFIKPDADVDGFTSAAYIRQFIETIAPDTEIIYNLNYHKEHGIFYDEVKDIDNLALIVVPDAGSDSIEDCKNIKEHMHVPVLILDHHEINPDIYEYATLINCMDGVYPNQTLSGVGVVHKFCLAYCDKYNINKKVCDEYLDLVALGMIADSMDMRNLETRYYTLQGLKEENRKNTFIKALAESFEDDMKMGHTIYSYGWVIAPKLNGVIRYGKPEEQKNLFRAICQEIEYIEYQPRRKSKDDPLPPTEIHTLQQTMARISGNVKSRQDNEVRKFMKEIDEIIINDHLDKNSVIMIDGTDILAKSTVGGLVANKLAEKYQRPILMLKKMFNDPDVFGGSARGYDKCKITDFKELLQSTQLFDKCAGHKQAYGIQINKKNVSHVLDVCNKIIKPEDLVTILSVDMRLMLII
jgi:single-stranded-DNA-specific exonuclease